MSSSEIWAIFFFVSYLGSGPITWLVYGILTFAGRTKMLLLDKKRPFPNPVPHVTILIPAKDEAERIERCLQSALNQDYPNFDLLAVDDRSVDGTAEKMDALAAANPQKMSVLHIQPHMLQTGWTGKNNALHTASQQARGDWLLFVDSDVILEPAALSRTMSAAVFKEYDLLSLLPKVEAHTLWESTLIPLCSLCAGTMYLIALNNDNKVNKISFANGQFMLFPRKSYDAIGGHELVKDRFCEDVEMARLMKERGMRPRISWGEKYCSVRMYNSLSGIIKGWSRIYYAAKVGNPKHLLMAIWFLLSNCFIVYPALAYGIYRHLHPDSSHWLWNNAWLLAAVLHYGLMTFFLACMYRWSKNSALNALLFPLSSLLLLWTLLKGLSMCFTKKVEWRGTSYSYTMNQNVA